MALNIIMLGPPGAGKGTQAERLARARCIPRISTGDILRDAVHAGSELGSVARLAMDAGRLVSDDVMIGIVRERLERPDALGGFVLDGFPRTVPQARALDVIMVGRDPLVVLQIVVPEEELVRRVRGRRLCGTCGVGADPGETGATCGRCGGPLVHRSDDGAEVVRERLKVYTRQTEPLIEYYRQRPTYRVVDGNQPPDAVAEALRAALDGVASPPRGAGRAGSVEPRL